ncbi:MAG: hypothetical protein O7A67_10670 [SAR324 cluster bacterium]|nr:hypothetical protein [SAR324 cluster bacterium]
MKIFPVIVCLPLWLLLLGAAPVPAEEAECPSGAERVLCLAERGSPQAQFQVGMDAFSAASTPEEFARALDWFRRAAEQEYGRAQYMLAMMHWEGWGTARDAEAAYRWLLRAAGNRVMDGAGIKPRIERFLMEQQAQETDDGAESGAGDAGN